MYTLIGRFFDTINWTNYYIENNNNDNIFFKDLDKEDTNIILNDTLNLVSEDKLCDYSLCLNSPWSLTTLNYHIKYNKELASWVCIYSVNSVIGYEGIYTEIYGYGVTPDVALNDCNERYSLFQTRYNPNNEFF